jgi:hypothetical protein
MEDGAAMTTTTEPTTLDLLKAKREDLRERIEAKFLLIDQGEATHHDLDQLIAESAWLLAFTQAHIRHLEQDLGRGT